MIADSAPVDGFKGSRGGVDVKLAALAGFFRWFAQGLAVEREAVRSVHEAVEDGIGDCRIDDHLVPVIDGELTGDDGSRAGSPVRSVTRHAVTIDRCSTIACHAC